MSFHDNSNKNIPQPQEVPHGGMMNIKLPTFPTNELMPENNRVDISYKRVVKETSGQTDIVWENVSEYLRQQSGTKEPTSGTDSHFSDFIEKPSENFVLSKAKIEPETMEALQSNTINTNGQIKEDHFINTIDNNYSHADVLLIRDSTSKAHCPHTHMKKFKINSCIACKNNVKFSVMNINHLSHSQHISSSGSPDVIEISKPKLAPKKNLFPSERYKQMKQAQREHFENDPRISKTLKRIYEAAKTCTRTEITSSSSSSRYHVNDPQHSSNVCSFVQHESLQPDLYTLSDELLLFGIHSTDEFKYSSHLLKTESSQDTSSSSHRFCGKEISKDVFLRNNLMCTNSEESSGNSFYNKRGSDLERYLLKDIENSWSDPAVLSSVFSTSSLERKVNEIQLDDLKSS